MAEYKKLDAVANADSTMGKASVEQTVKVDKPVDVAPPQKPSPPEPVAKPKVGVFIRRSGNAFTYQVQMAEGRVMSRLTAALNERKLADITYGVRPSYVEGTLSFPATKGRQRIEVTAYDQDLIPMMSFDEWVA